jgi:hypothetical protein
MGLAWRQWRLMLTIAAIELALIGLWYMVRYLAT